MSYVLLGADGRPYRSDVKGQWGGHRAARIYGRLDCPSALRAIARGGYVRHRVFFADEVTAITAGYRPCGICCPGRYQPWKAAGDAIIHPRPPGLRQAAGSSPGQTRRRARQRGTRHPAAVNLQTGPRSP